MTVMKIPHMRHWILLVELCVSMATLSKTLNFIHIYFADSKNKLMFNLAELQVLKKRTAAPQMLRAYIL